MEIRLDSPFDAHLHLRDGEMLSMTVPASAATFSGAVVMPNLQPSVTSVEQADAYRQRILEHAQGNPFSPCMTLFMQDHFDEAYLSSVKGKIIGVKLYPSGVTTNSEGGLASVTSPKAKKVLAVMEALEIPLLVHGETNGFVLDREAEFTAIYEELAVGFPKLKIMMEHISTKALAELLDRYENLYASITLHHLTITLNDLFGGGLKPHLFCKPTVKTPKDQEALLELALNAHPKVMFGSDSAPHPKAKKESANGAAGVFTAPFALPALAQLFQRHGKPENLQPFVSDNAKRIYSLELPQKTVVLADTPWSVPESYGDVVPMLAGETLEWSVREVLS